VSSSACDAGASRASSYEMSARSKHLALMMFPTLPLFGGSIVLSARRPLRSSFCRSTPSCYVWSRGTASTLVEQKSVPRVFTSQRPEGRKGNTQLVHAAVAETCRQAHTLHTFAHILRQSRLMLQTVGNDRCAPQFSTILCKHGNVTQIKAIGDI
jgi:hypothetical protein